MESCVIRNSDQQWAALDGSKESLEVRSLACQADLGRKDEEIRLDILMAFVHGGRLSSLHNGSGELHIKLSTQHFHSMLALRQCLLLPFPFNHAMAIIIQELHSLHLSKMY